MGRSVVFGFDDRGFVSGSRERVMWDEDFATNAHMLVAGKSGTGKTFTLQRIVSQMINPLQGREPVRVHNFDVHGDMHYQNESRTLFSESTYFGINPLRLSPDPHYGGVRKCVQNFIEMMSDSSPRAQLGPRQVTALRNILYELFESKGLRVNEPGTWAVESSSAEASASCGKIYLDVPYDERELAKSAARNEGVSFQFDSENKSWWCSDYVGTMGRWPVRSNGRRAPTIPEAARFISTRLRSMLTGGGTKTIKLLEEHNKKVVVYQAKLRKLQEGGDSADMEALQGEIHNGSAALIETFSEYVQSIETGRELDTLARYESSETLKAIGDRLDTLVATGIFKPREAQFDPAASIWSYDIAPLRDSEQQFFVWTKLKQILDDAMELGPVAGASEVRVCIVIDEAHKFFLHKDTNILDKIAKEGRKFGVSMICASQAPSHFSEDFLGNVGTKVLLGLDPMYRDSTVRKMRIDPAILDYVVAGKIAAVQISDKRDMSHQFRKTRVGN